MHRSARTSTNEQLEQPKEFVRLTRREGPVKLFCIHQSGGDVGIFRKLARYLDPRVEAVGIQSRLMAGETQEWASIEEMADHYCHLIDRVPSFEPIGLLGFSFGGFVATAMVNRLRQRRPVAFLGLIDSNIESTRGGQLARQEAVSRFLETSYHFQRTGLCPMYSPERLKQDVASIVNRFFAGQPISFNQVMDELDSLGYFIQSDSQRKIVSRFAFNFLTHCQMLCQFRPQFVDMPIHLWWPSETVMNVQDNGWREWTDQTFESTIPGNHFSMMREPNIRRLAKEVNEKIDQFPV